MIYYFRLIFLFLFSFLFSNSWESSSVSTSEDIDALFNNPAGLGIDHGKQYGYSYSYNDSDSSFFNYSHKQKAYAFSFDYNSNSTFSNPYNGIFGFGSNFGENINWGLSHSKVGLFSYGLIFRPTNYLSFGGMEKIDKNTNSKKQIMGLAIRPLNNHKLMFAIDLAYNDYLGKPKPSAFLNIEPLNGINVATQYDINHKEFTFSVNLTIKKNDISINSNNKIGILTNNHIKKTVLKPKYKQKFINMNLNGTVIEERPRRMPFLNIPPFVNNKTTILQLRDWIKKIYQIKDDNSIDGIIINLKSIQAGFSKRHEMANALLELKNNGKKIIVYSEQGISNADYYLISMADKIITSNMTPINLKGISMEFVFLRDLLDTLKIEPEVFRVEYNGKSYKTAADPFLYNKMSKEMKDNYEEVLNDWYDIFVTNLAEGRNWTIEKTKQNINNGPYFISQKAYENEIIDSVMYSEQFKSFVKNYNGIKTKIVNSKSYFRTKHYNYNWKDSKKSNIAVLYAVGGIISGKSNSTPRGTSLLGDKTLIKAIKSAKNDKNIDAIILRIDSPGGSAQASDNIWNAINKEMKFKKPFIASMSDVAASGGYYIACAADTIISTPSTITGSIGVIYSRLNYSNLLKNFGINFEYLNRGNNANFLSGSRLVNQQEYEKIQESVNDVYSTFKDKVILGRSSKLASHNKDSLDQTIAMGRVFSGKRAYNMLGQNSLVDIMGGFYDAIDIAKKMAKIPIENDIRIIEYPKKTSLNTYFNQNFYSQNTLNNFLYYLENSDYINLLKVLNNSNMQLIMPYKISLN